MTSVFSRPAPIVRDKQLEAAGVLPSGIIREAAKSPLEEHLDSHFADLRALQRSEAYLSELRDHFRRLQRGCG